MRRNGEGNSGRIPQPNEGRGKSLQQAGGLPIEGPELARHLRRAQFARAVGELSDVDIDTNAPELNQGLIWNGENWVPGAGGGTVLIEVRNESGTAIARNAAVYVSGEHTSGKPLVDLADASDNALMPAIGLVQDEILNNTEGYVIAAGSVEGLQLDPAVYNDGDALYVSASTPGALTNVKPTGYSAGPPEAVDKVQKVALVTKVSSNATSNNGWAIVMGAGRVNDQNNEIVRLIGRKNEVGVFDGTSTDTSLGPSPGAPIADNSTIYDALTAITQDLGVPNDGSVTTNKLDSNNSIVVLTGVPLGDSDLGTFNATIYGVRIPDNSDNKEAFQYLSTFLDAAYEEARQATRGVSGLDADFTALVTYHGRYDTEAGTQRAAGDVSPLTCEVYYTARPDGDGYAESEETATPPSGARIVRRLYYSDKFNADPTVSADWTAYTTQPADGTSFAAAKASLLAGLSDTDATANTRGTLPVSLKMEYEAVLDRLLNDYPGAEAAYSVRLIDKNYSGPCMRVRNVSTNARSDIGFTTDGDLDTDAIATLCGSANGAVEIWYDQSGGGHHQVQNTTTLQPFIYLGGSGVLFQNGRPVIIFTDGGQLQNVSYTGSPSVAVSTMASFTTTSPAPGYTFCVVGPGGDYSTYSNFMIGTSTGGGTRFGFCTTTGTVSPDTSISCTHFVNQLEQISPTQSSLYAAIDPQAVVTTEWTSTDLSPRRWYINYNFPFAGSLQVQEYVIYYADKGTDQSAIEQAIDTYYRPTTARFLDNYNSPTAAAYSVRKLSQWYTGNCMKVRRGDGQTQDIGFDSNGDLDTAAIKSFCDAGGAGTLGYVVTWYDQSGNGNDATQSETTQQPQIYDGTAVLTRNGKPAPYFNGSSRMAFDASTVNQPFTWFGVVQRDDTTNSVVVGWNVFSFIGRYEANDFSIYAGTYLGSSSFNSTAQQMFYGLFNTTSSELAVNGGTAVTGSANTRNMTGGGYIGADGGGGTRMQGTVQELILWPSNQSGFRTSIESDINTYFSVY